MQIIDFAAAYVERAVKIALQNYEEERRHVPDLPPVDAAPDFIPFINNNLGVAAFEGESMLGFLCSVDPYKNAFNSTDAIGIFSPMGANGAIGENRGKVYAHMYQAAGEKWIRAGAASHAVCLYAHDKEAQAQFYRYGFGMRCVDAIRGMNEIAAAPCEDYTFYELAPEDVLRVLQLENLLDECYLGSPFFMFREPSGKDSFLKSYEYYHSIYFVAEYGGQIVAFIRAELDGETFIKNTPGYLHVKGAFCLREHRGKGVSQFLLNLLIHKLKTQGYTRLGVDFESFNPSGSGFWLKYFAAYNHSVVRRIDEYAISKREAAL